MFRRYAFIGNIKEATTNTRNMLQKQIIKEGNDTKVTS